MNELKEGVRLSKLFWPDDAVTTLGGDITAMVVVMQPGQGAMVPWVKLLGVKGEISLYNLAWLTGVTIAAEVDTQKGGGE